MLHGKWYRGHILDRAERCHVRCYMERRVVVWKRQVCNTVMDWYVRCYMETAAIRRMSEKGLFAIISPHLLGTLTQSKTKWSPHRKSPRNDMARAPGRYKTLYGAA